MPTTEYELFAGIPAASALAILQRLPRAEVAAGGVLLREGESSDRVILVEHGELEVWKGPPATPAGVHLAHLVAGDCFGEISAEHATPSSATIVAATAAAVRYVTLADLPADPATREIITLNLSRTLVCHLTAAHAAVQAKHEREARAVGKVAAASAFVTRMLLALASYMLSLPLIAVITPLLPTNSLISFFFIAVFGWVVVSYMERHPEVRQEYWFMTLRGWPRQLLRGLVWSIPPLLVFVAIKLSFMHVRGDAMRFFEPMTAIRYGAPMNLPVWLGFALVYAALCSVQEFIRCAFQGTLEALDAATAHGNPWKSILVADVIYSSMHVHLGGAFAAQAFIGGLFFGYEFYRERSYLAVAVSHTIVGVIAVFVVGIPR